MCLFLYLKFKFASTYLFLFVSVTTYNTSALQLITQVLNVLVVSLCKPVIHKLKILDGKKLEYEKSIREGAQKWGKPNFEISVEEGAKGGT